MPTDQVLINLPQIQAVPLNYVLPAASELLLQAATATFDGTAAGTSFLPCMQIIGPGGVVAATFVDPSVSVQAGGSAEVTFGPFLRSRTTLPGGTGFLSTLLALNPDAIWPLDELSGTVAHDILSGHHDAGTSGSTPTWNALASPGGTQEPHFGNLQGFNTSSSGFTPTLSGDFTLGGWFRYDTQQFAIVAGTDTHGGASVGFGILVNGPGDTNPNTLAVAIGTGSTFVQIQSDLPITTAAQYFVMVTRLGGVFNLFVNGVAQAVTYGGTYSAGGARSVWLGYDGSGFPATANEYLWMWAIWSTVALTNSQISSLYSSV